MLRKSEQNERFQSFQKGPLKIINPHPLSICTASVAPVVYCYLKQLLGLHYNLLSKYPNVALTEGGALPFLEKAGKESTIDRAPPLEGRPTWVPIWILPS
jgi:hypothetical protein